MSNFSKDFFLGAAIAFFLATMMSLAFKYKESDAELRARIATTAKAYQPVGVLDTSLPGCYVIDSDKNQITLQPDSEGRVMIPKGAWIGSECFAKSDDDTNPTGKPE